MFVDDQLTLHLDFCIAFRMAQRGFMMPASYGRFFDRFTLQSQYFFNIDISILHQLVVTQLPSLTKRYLRLNCYCVDAIKFTAKSCL